MLNFRFVFSLFLVIAAVHLLGMWREWYWDIRWLDTPMHLAGGFWVATLFLWLRNIWPEHIKTNSLYIDWFIVLGVVMLVGVMWEFYEFVYDAFWAKTGLVPISQLGMMDTMKDLLMDATGGLLAYVISLLLRRKA